MRSFNPQSAIPNPQSNSRPHRVLLKIRDRLGEDARLDLVKVTDRHHAAEFAAFDHGDVADAFLAPALSRPNLVLRDRAVTTRILFDRQRAVGVEFVRDGKTESARATREIVLAAGAIETPKLLLLSGIGAAADLKAHGIPVRVDNPHVGAHLQDHPRVSVRWQSRQTLAPWKLALRSSGLSRSSDFASARLDPSLSPRKRT